MKDVAIYVPLVIIGFAIFLVVVLRQRRRPRKQMEQGQGISIDRQD